MTIEVSVNGEPRQVPAGTTVGQLVAAVTDLGGGVAAAVNGEVVPHSSWAATRLGAGDLVEIVTAVPGG
jgi:sulfur carrier protein